MKEDKQVDVHLAAPGGRVPSAASKGAPCPEHTPGEWRYQEGADAYTHIIRADAAPGTMVCHLPQDSSGISEANARRIVQCVNQRDELLDALEWMLDAFGERNRPPKVLIASAAVHKARAAIAKATGSTP